MSNLNHIKFKKNIVSLKRVDKINSKYFNHIAKGNGKRMRRKVQLILFIIGLIFISSFNTNIFGQVKNNIRYITLPGSKLWIDGTSNIDSYTCKTHYVSGYADIEKEADNNSPSAEQDTVMVSVLVHSLDCGKGLMNDDMYNAMKANKFPYIKYELLEAHLSSRPDSLKDWFTLDTKGNLYIAGERNTVNIKMQVEKLPDGLFRLIGSKPLSMLDYGIIPPSHFFGLIHAHDKLVVHFDLLASREPNLKSISHDDEMIAK